MTNSSTPLPFFYVGKEVTSQRKSKFIAEKYPALCNALGRDDTRSIWYSREHIVKLLEEIDHASGDGLRVYFGAYEDGHEFAGQMCLVINTTRERNLEGLISHVNVELENEPDFQNRSTLSKTFNLQGTATKKDFNFGSPCPPRCDGGDEPGS